TGMLPRRKSKIVGGLLQPLLDAGLLTIQGESNEFYRLDLHGDCFRIGNMMAAVCSNMMQSRQLPLNDAQHQFMQWLRNMRNPGDLLMQIPARQPKARLAALEACALHELIVYRRIEGTIYVDFTIMGLHLQADGTFTGLSRDEPPPTLFSKVRSIEELILK